MQSFAIAQDDELDKCTEIKNKEARELFQKGTDRKKYDKSKRLQFLTEAVEIEPEYTEANYILAKEIILTANYNNASLDPAEPYLQKIVDACPDFHSDPYYYLATIFYDRQEYGKAYEYYKKFLNFPAEDSKKTAKDYDKKFEQAKVDMKYAKFYHEKLNKPVPFDPKIVKHVSGDADEYLPVIAPDNESLFFTRKSLKQSKVRVTSFESDKPLYTESFSFAKNNNNGTFDTGKPMPLPFNADENSRYGGASVSIDNKHIYLTICKPGKVNPMSGQAYINCDIYSSDYVFEFEEKEGKETWHWTELKNLGSNINTEDGWESQPSISSDGNTLYFATSRAESKGIDIYYSQKGTGGEWGEAKPVGDPINSSGNDKSPFIHSDSQTLYFASDGHVGFGGFDIYYSRMKDGKWLEPENIGYPINTKQDEHGFIVSTDGSRVYFGSDILKELGSGLDIYTFELYEEARPKKVLFVKGRIENEIGEGVPATVELKNTTTNETASFIVDAMDKKFAGVIVVEKNEEVIMNIKSENMAFNSRLLKPDTNGNIYQATDAKLEQIEVGKPYRINEIYYATNSAEITEISKKILDEFAAYLKENTTLKIAIHGHTDDVGSDSDNLALSSDRAFSVMDYLQNHGVAKERLSFKGFGESKPVATNTTPEGRALNRRTEFVVLAK
jgi:outer membrane protein OmpA-like peptidoglycan-associated protein/tetratricopeptide (TPR) repeat protein